jgi:GH35 family endo-1,4-beta-xylanase
VKNINNKWGILFAAVLAFTACQQEEESPSVSVTGVSLEDMNLTVFASRRITPAFEPSNATNKRGTWTSSDPDVVSVSDNGTITALKYTDETTGTGQATLTFTTKDGGFTDTCVVTVTMAAQEHINDLKPLKDLFKYYFMMGNIFDPGDVPDDKTINKPWLIRHYNILTPQNQMKPVYMCGRPPTGAAPGQYDEANIATAKRMIAAARANGIKVQGHCLLWHEQIPRWQENLRTSADTKEEVLGYLREYITYIVTEFKGSIYAWDVLNEVFPNGVIATDNWKNVMRSGSEGNPWYMKLGADFVYEGFLAARQADPDIILYYNDYSLDLAGKAAMVRDMVRDVNKKYADEHPEANGRKLIEGIGMQSHHNANVTAAAIKKTLDLFRPLGVKISVSELDLLAQTYNDYEARRTPTNAALLKQAIMYGEYFNVFLEYSDIIERITFWGVSDASSWRSSALPLPFDGRREGWTLIPESIKAKPAYYKMIEALENY